MRFITRAVFGAGQHLLPRYEFFKEVTKVFRADGHTCPVFNDKHLSWSWPWAQEMVAESRELGFALGAGSSTPSSESARSRTVACEFYGYIVGALGLTIWVFDRYLERPSLTHCL